MGRGPGVLNLVMRQEHLLDKSSEWLPACGTKSLVFFCMYFSSIGYVRKTALTTS